MKTMTLVLPTMTTIVEMTTTCSYPLVSVQCVEGGSRYMELRLSEEQYNNLDGADIEIRYSPIMKAHLLSLTAEKSREVTSVWIDEELRNKIIKAFSI